MTLIKEYEKNCLTYSNAVQLSGKIDVFVSHDWPVGVTDYGDVEDLYSTERNTLGPFTVLHKVIISFLT